MSHLQGALTPRLGIASGLRSAAGQSVPAASLVALGREGKTAPRGAGVRDLHPTVGSLLPAPPEQWKNSF